MSQRLSFSMDDLEHQLKRALRPIPLPAEELERVRRRIRYMPSVRVARRMFEWEFWFIVIGGLVTAFMLILTLARALFYIFGRK